MNPEFCQLWLTCEDDKEASKVAHMLLDKRLIVCAKQLPLTADYWWQGSKEHAAETLLVMETRLDLFDIIEAEVKKIHSYDTFALQALPLLRVSQEATMWLKENTAGPIGIDG